MVRRVYVFLVVAILTSSLAADEKKPVSIKWEKDFAKGRAAMQADDRPMLLYLTAPGCVYCEKMKAETFAQTNVIDQLNEQYVTVRLNGRKNKEIVQLLRVRMYPTTAIVHQSGKVVEILQGYKKPAEFQNHLAIAKAKLNVENRLVAAKQSTVRVK